MERLVPAQVWRVQMEPLVPAQVRRVPACVGLSDLDELFFHTPMTDSYDVSVSANDGQCIIGASLHIGVANDVFSITWLSTVIVCSKPHRVSCE